MNNALTWAARTWAARTLAGVVLLPIWLVVGLLYLLYQLAEVAAWLLQNSFTLTLGIMKFTATGKWCCEVDGRKLVLRDLP